MPLDLRGVTAFREAVLRELMQVPYGETTTYGVLAERLGDRAGSLSASARQLGVTR